MHPALLFAPHVNNSPVNYIDPTGHFSEDAIYSYLYEQCLGDSNEEDAKQAKRAAKCASSMMATWKADTDWWDMITTAEAEDTLFGIYDSSWKTMSSDHGHVFLFTFEGEGQDVLRGISPSSSYPSPFNSYEMPTLEEVRKGSQTRTRLGSFGYGQGSETLFYTWMGFIRNINTWPAFYIRSGYSFNQNSWKPATSRVIDGYAGIATGLVFQSKAATIILGLVGMVGTPTLSDALDMEPGDVNVTVGPIYFNFQGIPGGGWTLEKVAP